jgi:hypothetical protein
MKRAIVMAILGLAVAAPIAGSSSAALAAWSSLPSLSSPSETIYVPDCRLDPKANCEERPTS